MKRHLAVVLAVASTLIGASWVGAQDPKKKEAEPPAGKAAPGPLKPFPEGYPDHKGLTDALKRVASEHPEVVRLDSIAKTREGRDVWVVTLGKGAPKPPRPSILVVGNAEADHVVGSVVALGLVERLATGPIARLDGRTIYVVPRLNPDGAERLLHAAPRHDLRTNLTPIDRDRDGKAGEDGPNDLDGDGLALAMRVKDAKATLVPDAKDPRVLRKADPAKGERAVYSERTEGLDDDGDGEVDEDPPGGVNLNRNWPHGWAEYSPEAGTSPAGEPEVNALIRFAFDRPEIVAIWSFGLNDNLKAEAKGIAPADAPYFADLTRAFAKATGSEAPAAAAAKDEPKAPAAPEKAEVSKKAFAKGQGKGQGKAQAKGQGQGQGGNPGPSPTAPPTSPLDGTTDGALSEWAYHQLGVVGLGSRLWPGPDPAPGGPALSGEGEARWLDWDAKVVGGSAFVPFRPFDHPTLGKVEIGGWKPGVRLNPPASQVDAIVAGHLAFLDDLAGRLPALAIKEAKAESRGGGVFELTATVENAGYLPTALAQGLTTRKAPPILVRLRLPKGATLLAGKALERVDGLPGSGGSRPFRWLVLAPEAGAATVDASCPKAGRAVRELPLR